MDTRSASRLWKVVMLSVAFGYIEASVVVYLRAIFYKDGFVFPITDFGQMPGAMRFFLTEAGREVSTIVLIYCAAWLVGQRLRERLAYFMIIFAVWDIFFYVWLKVLVNWPVRLLDWDILFLIPVVWAGPVLAPVITSVLMLWVSRFLLGKRPFAVSAGRWAVLGMSAAGIIACFCVAGLKIGSADYARYFNWPVFIVVHAVIAGVVLRCRGLNRR